MTREYCLIDKTRPLEEMLETSSGICLCGMPGLGKKTMIRMLLERHPEVAPRVCALKDLLLPETEKPEGKTACWYLVQNLSETGTAGAVGTAAVFLFSSPGRRPPVSDDGRRDPRGIAGICLERKSESGVPGLFLVYPGGDRALSAGLQKSPWIRNRPTILPGDGPGSWRCWSGSRNR